MKTLSLILITIFFSAVTSHDVFTKDVKLKKLDTKAVLERKLDIFSNGKKKLKQSFLKQAKKETGKETEYTVWPKDGKVIPKDSLYFPADHDPEHKSRVKKIISEYSPPHVRSKRSVNKADPKKSVRKPVAPKATNKKILSTKSSKGKAKTKNKQAHRSKKSVKSRNAKIASKPKSRSKQVPRSNKAVGSKKSNKKIGNVKPRQHKREGKSHHVKKSRALNDSRRLIGGKDATIEDFPFVVSIQKEGEHWCTGSLLNQRLVITTANCIWKASKVSRLRVRAGSRHIEEGGQLAKIQEVMKHPGWSIRKHPDNDVALLLLDRFIKFSHNVHSVDLPNRVMYPAFEDAWVVSWGTDRRDGVVGKWAPSLQWYLARVMDRDKCNNVTMRFGVSVTKNFICMTQKGRRAPCTRDTGAPAVSDGILWGMASWGIRKMCGTERYPAMFSYIASHSNMDFITNASRMLMSEDIENPFLDKPRWSHAPITDATETTNPYQYIE